MNRARQMMKLGMFDSGGDPFAGYSYYVNSVTGSDDNAGTSSLLPFATITKLLTVYQAGDSVGLAKDSTWRGSITGNHSVYAYGAAGNKPLLDCSDIAANASFTKTGGQTNVYQIDVVIEGGVGFWVSAWENDTRLVRAASLAACDSTAGSYYPSADATSPITLYIHASDNSDISTNGKVYEYSRWGSGVDSFGYTGITIDGIHSRRAGGESGSFRLGNSSILSNCQSDEGNKHNVYVGDGCTVANVTCSKAYYNPASPSHTYFVYNANSAAGLGVTFTGCTVDNGGVLDSNGTGFYGHSNGAGTFGTVTFINCTVTDIGAGFSGIDADFVLTGCTTTGCTYGYSVNNVGYDYTMTNCIGSIGTPSGMGVAVNVTTNLTIAGCTFVNTASKSNQKGIATGANNIAITVTGITTFDNLVYGIHAVSGTGGTISVSGGDFITMTRNYDTALNGPAITSDYNRFREAGQDFSVQGTLYGDVAAYQAGTGQDANSTVG
jgi:hypothetical protein